VPAFRITLAYDGTNYVGWQRQAQGASIQGLVEAAVAELDGRAVAVAGAGRTDAGVHAFGQVASFTLARHIDPGVLRRALNARLPPDVRVLEAVPAAPDFHARFAATGKTYRYRICDAEALSPFERRYAWHLPGPLDVPAMDDAARVLEGRHDFTAFQTAGGETHTAERTIARSRVRRESAALVVYEIRGDGFLRHMVRSIAGTLAEIGRGRGTRDRMREILASRSRSTAGVTAPAKGLFLVSVEYGDL
jgi:tRNA pseudouridine38-40 synthase